MKRRYLLFLLPIAGLLLGYLLADIDFRGTNETWHLLGQPGEPVAKIWGVQDSEKLMVEAASGSFYSIPVREGDEMIVQPPGAWRPETGLAIHTPQSVQYYGADFNVKRLTFRPGQVYDYSYIYHVEGKGQAQFAIDPRGSVWIWSHAIGGLDGLVYFFYPVIWFGIGLIAALVLWGVIRFRAGRA